MICVLLAAFIAAQLSAGAGTSDLHRLEATGTSNPAAYPYPENSVIYYQTMFTAWATIVLLIPALTAFWFRDHSERAAEKWLLFWTVSYIAFLIHIFWAMFIYFEADFKWMINSPQVSAFWPDLFVGAWWGVDVLLAWIKTEERWVRIQRITVHAIVLAFFVVASVYEGAFIMSKILGSALFLSAATSAVVAIVRKRSANAQE